MNEDAAHTTVRHSREEMLEIQRESMRKRCANNLTYHAPKEGQQERYVALRAAALEFALLVIEMTPLSREQAVALTEIETAVMWANAAIARNE